MAKSFRSHFTPQKVLKFIYKTFRSVIFSVTLIVVGLYVLAYVLLSIPAFTEMVKNRTCQELGLLLGGKVQIDKLNIYPFNEMTVEGLRVYDPEGEKCIEVDKVGAGIRLWKLITEGDIEITYGEIIGLKADIVQQEKYKPLNIDFIIKAFASKDNKEKKHFKLALKNVVLRKSEVSFRRPWMQDKKLGELDLSALKVTDLAADITFPVISDEGVDVDLRRLSMKIQGVAEIDKIGLKGKFGNNGIEIEDFILQLPASQISIPEFSLVPDKGESLAEALNTSPHSLVITDSHITPADFRYIFPPLSSFTEQLPLEVIVSGTPEDIIIDKFDFGKKNILVISFTGSASDIKRPESLRGEVKNLDINIARVVFARLLPSFESLPEQASGAIEKLGNVEVKANLSCDMGNQALIGNLDFSSDACNFEAEADLRLPEGGIAGEGELIINELNIETLIPEVSVGNLRANITAEGSYISGDAEGTVSLVVEELEYRGVSYDGFSIDLTKNASALSGGISMHNVISDLELDFECDIFSHEKNGYADLSLDRLNLTPLFDMKGYKDYIMSGNLSLEATGSNIDDLRAELNLKDFSLQSPDNSRNLLLHNLKLKADLADSVLNYVDLRSDWVNARAEGKIKPSELPDQVKQLAFSVFPVLDKRGEIAPGHFVSDIDFDILVKKNNDLAEFFKLPVRMLVPLEISGNISSSENSGYLTLNLPYLQQGKDKLIYDTRLALNIDGNAGTLDATIATTMPVKKGDLALNVDLYGKDNGISTDLRWVNTINPDFNGHLVLDTDFSKNPITRQPEINAVIQPSVMKMGASDWNITRSEISYSDKTISVDGLKIWHDEQFIEIDGSASPSFEDVMKITLADIDVDYIFDTLQINYVVFGGVATGEIAGRSLLSGNPVAETEYLNIEDFSYNGAVVGDCVVTSRWVNDEKKIEIGADISHAGKRRVLGSGGIWLSCDSLSFDIAAEKVPVEFVQPFMSVFSSEVGGYATGAVKLFGNFHDIDMTGKIFADSVAVKLDYTNTIYHGSDSVILTPGKIEIPNFTLYDKYGHSALLTGELTHKYFHDPEFTFRLSDAHDFLCYDTSAELNPDWYGVLFGNGTALVRGVPGLVDISADMTVVTNSTFTFVLNETEYATDYQFLTFSDKRAEAKVAEEEKEVDFKELFRKKVADDTGGLSKFVIDIRATVTPQALFTLVMDPAAGDKIVARGRGALQMKYASDTDELAMYGKYEIDEGNYNFSLQDIILRDFKIKEGSSISFNGDPLAADLDISATYRVNTNLSDLDKSFSTDRDLNRTNVPVDAVLSVEGNMENPDITFDIELPTLTQDVERKVKSIISTDDMMNRQIIYLLALNRFYTPEYMGNTGNGGELAAVASSTISSQLSNMLGQLTDKFSVAPSFRSDKGDFSDLEVDVALSSRLLNNRLLINGNFGYRDRSTSSTTFVGDFDVEYLLSKNGNLRLKAYNHFNDQNYYLREALTTQGLGVVYRRDFDDWFTFLKRRSARKKKESNNELDTDEGNDRNDGDESQNMTESAND